MIDLIQDAGADVGLYDGPAPASVAAALAALDVIAAEPERVAAPLAKARRFTAALDLPDAQSAVVPIILGEAERALAAAAALEALGLLVAPIRPPTVPEGTARLRVAFTAGHPDEAIDRLVEALRPWLSP